MESPGFTENPEVFINSVICYARLYIMKCKIQDKQIAIEGFLNLIENEGVLYSI